MYSRDPRDKRQIKIPENYSGNAFRDNVYTDVTPPPTPEAQENEKSSPSPPMIIETRANNAPPLEAREKTSIFSSLIPSSRFPFGHGLGAEELFILGIMLLIYTSGDENDPPDNELLILLCILLFSG